MWGAGAAPFKDLKAVLNIFCSFAFVNGVCTRTIVMDNQRII